MKITIEGEDLEIVEQSDVRIVVEDGSVYVPPDPPPSGAEDWIKDNLYKLEGGKEVEDLSGWMQDKGYYDGHGRIPWSPDPVWMIQGDRDYKGRDIWSHDNPSEANIWKDVEATYEHSKVFLSYQEVHHMSVGSFSISLLGRNSEGEGWAKLLSFGPRTPPTDKDSVPVGVFADSVDASYKYYRVLIWGQLAVKRDGFLLGGFKLVGA